MKYPFLFFLFISITAVHQLESQYLNATVLDSSNQQPIPYATVQLNEKGVITNEDGNFRFTLDETIKETDSIIISCIGYERMAKPLSQFKTARISLIPRAIELKEVIVSNKNYTADEIMALVEDNLEKNYSNDLTKKRLFHRTSSFDRWIKSDFKVKKSSIPILNQQFLDSVIASVPKNNSYYF
jgi:hypothetical protein